MNGQQQNISSELNLNVYGFPVSMCIYNLPNLWAQRVQWSITVSVPLAFLIQVSAQDSLGKKVKVQRNVGKIRVELILPISFQEGKKLPYCFGVLICPRPQDVMDLVELCMFLLPMAYGQPKFIHELRKLFSELAGKFMTPRNSTTAKRGTNPRGRGRGGGRRGRTAESAAYVRTQRGRLDLIETGNASQKLETIDLVDEGPSVSKRVGTVKPSPADNTAFAVHSSTGTLNISSNSSLLPMTSEVKSLSLLKNNGLPESSFVLGASSPKNKSSNSSCLIQQDENAHQVIGNKFDHCQFHLCLKKRHFGSSNNEESVLTNSFGVPNTNSQSVQYQPSNTIVPNVSDASAQRFMLPNVSAVPGTTQRCPTMSRCIRYEPSNTIVPNVSDASAQRFMLPNVSAVPGTTQRCPTMSRCIRYEPSNMIAPNDSTASALNAMLTNVNSVPSTIKRFKASSHNILYRPPNIIEPSGPDMSVQNSILSNFIGVPNTTRCFPTSSQNIRYQPLHMIESSVPDTSAQNSVLTNFNGVQSTIQSLPPSSQNLRYQDSNMIAPSTPGICAKNDTLTNFDVCPITTQSFPTNCQNLQYQPSNTIALSSHDVHAQNSSQHQQISKYPLTGSTVSQNLQHFNNQHLYYRPWSGANFRTQSEQTTGKHDLFPTSTVTCTESRPLLPTHFNPPSYSDNAYSNLQAQNLSTFEEAISTGRPRNIYSAALNRYNQDNMYLESGLPINAPYVYGEEFNRHTTLAGHPLPNHEKRLESLNKQPSNRYNVHSGTNRTKYSNSNLKNQTIHGNDSFPNHVLSQDKPHHQSFNSNTHTAIEGTQNVHTNDLSVFTKGLPRETYIRSEEQSGRDYVSMLSNSPASSKLIKTFQSNQNDENNQLESIGRPADSAVGLYNNTELLFDNVSDYEDSNEPTLVINDSDSMDDTVNLGLQHKGNGNGNPLD